MAEILVLERRNLMLLEDIENSTAYKEVINTIQKISGISLDLEAGDFAYLEITKYFISNIPESIPDVIVDQNLKAIESLLNKNFGDANAPLKKAIEDCQAISAIDKNNNMAVSRFVQNLYPKNNDQALSSLRVQFNNEHLDQSNNEQAFYQSILESRLKANRDTVTTQIKKALVKYSIDLKGTDFLLIFSITSIRNIENDLQQLEVLKKSSNSTLQDIQKKQKEGATLVSYIATGAINGHYANRANKDDNHALWWKAVKILSIIVAILLLGHIVCQSDTDLKGIIIDKYKFIIYFLPRCSITVCILGLATYFGEQASHCRRNADFLRKRAFALQAISPYLDDIGKEKIESLIATKQKIVDNLLKDFDK